MVEKLFPDPLKILKTYFLKYSFKFQKTLRIRFGEKLCMKSSSKNSVKDLKTRQQIKTKSRPNLWSREQDPWPSILNVRPYILNLDIPQYVVRIGSGKWSATITTEAVTQGCSKKVALKNVLKLTRNHPCRSF